MFLRDYRSIGSASLDCTLYDNHESKISAEIANKDDNDFKIEAKARGTTESNIDGVKTKIEADCSGLWDIKNNDFKYKAKARGMTESNIDGATAKIEVGGSHSFKNKGSKPELDFKSSIQNDDLTFFQSEGLVKVDNQLTNIKLSSTIFRAKDENVDIKFLSAASESKVGKDKDGVSHMEKVGVNLIEADIKGFKAKVGINLDTGVSVNNDTIEAKYEGFGFKVGKEISLRTTFS